MLMSDPTCSCPGLTRSWGRAGRWFGQRPAPARMCPGVWMTLCLVAWGTRSEEGLAGGRGSAGRTLSHREHRWRGLRLLLVAGCWSPAAGHRPGLLLPPTPSGLFSEVLPWRCLWGPPRPSLPRQQLLSCTQACLEPVSLGAAGQVWAVGTGSLAPVPTGLEHATVHCSLSRYWVG